MLVISDAVIIYIAFYICTITISSESSVLLRNVPLLFLSVCLLLNWFIGGYSFIRWPWIPYGYVIKNWALLSTILSSVYIIYIFRSKAIQHPAIGYILFCIIIFLCGSMQRLLLQRIQRLIVYSRQKDSPVFSSDGLISPINTTSQNVGSKDQILHILIVAYHPSELEVCKIKSCLDALRKDIKYSVVINDYIPNEPAEQLEKGAEIFIRNTNNLGYGRAINQLCKRFSTSPEYIGILNTDLHWVSGTFERALEWLKDNPEVSLAVPKIINEDGETALLCKHHPTVLGMMSRRFLHKKLKNKWLRDYDSWYVMRNYNYDSIMPVEYLSGCCMIAKYNDFISIGGFDERYFLYLEDADITRSLSTRGACVHMPIVTVVHGWGKGNYRHLSLMAENLISSWKYFKKWGWKIM